MRGLRSLMNRIAADAAGPQGYLGLLWLHGTYLCPKQQRSPSRNPAAQERIAERAETVSNQSGAFWEELI